MNFHIEKENMKFTLLRFVCRATNFLKVSISIQAAFHFHSKCIQTKWHIFLTRNNSKLIIRTILVSKRWWWWWSLSFCFLSLHPCFCNFIIATLAKQNGAASNSGREGLRFEASAETVLPRCWDYSVIGVAIINDPQVGLSNQYFRISVCTRVYYICVFVCN